MTKIKRCDICEGEIKPGEKYARGKEGEIYCIPCYEEFPDIILTEE